MSRLWAYSSLAVAVLAAAPVRAEPWKGVRDAKAFGSACLQPAAFGWADALVAERRARAKTWRLDIGFSAFPSVDAPDAKRQPGT